MNRTDKIMITAWGLWGTLGCYRGHQYYKKEVKRHNERNIKTQYYYISNFGFCIAGILCYVTPPTMLIPIFIEVYNLEEAIRGIKSDD